MGEVKSLLDILELQKQLDETISKKRDSGFVPRERGYKDIILSMVAEIIEFNEETRNSHKTWKEKDFNIDKMKEEAVDILFFLAQLANYFKKDDDELQTANKLWKREWGYKEEYQEDELDLLKQVVNDRFHYPFFKVGLIISSLVKVYKDNNISEQEVYEIYYKKWQKNMGRIKGDWTK